MGNASFVYDESAGSTFNDQGADRDFRVESDSNTHALFVDAGSSEVGINNDTPDAALHVKTTAHNVTLFESNHSTGTQFFIRNSNATTGTSTLLGFAPANNVSGSYIESVANEDFSSSANRTANMMFYTRKDGAFYQRLYMDDADIVFNNDGRNTDFRVESDTNSHALFVDAGNNVVGMNISNPSSYYANDLVIQAGNEGGLTLASSNTTNSNYFMFADASSGNGRFAGYVQYDHNTDTMILATAEAPRLHLDGAEVTVNEGGYNTDFRVESDSNTHALFVEGDNTSNRIKLGMGTGTITNPYSQNNFTDLNLDGTWGGVISFKLGGTEYGWIGQRNSGNGDMIVGASSGQSLFLASNGNNSRIELTDAGNVVVNPTGADNDFR